MTRLQSLLSVLLVLILGLSTYAVGVARGQAPAVGEMVLCTGQGIVTVGIDAEGNPVERQTLCPDNAATLLAAVAVAGPALPVAPAVLGRRSLPAVAAAPLLPRPGARQARAPPLV